MAKVTAIVGFFNPRLMTAAPPSVMVIPHKIIDTAVPFSFVWSFHLILVDVTSCDWASGNDGANVLQRKWAMRPQFYKKRIACCVRCTV